ncbi:TonB-dependent receptor [Sphingobium sp. HWE2-09]|uniref:TonB-dependent receptor n=1 Tax=Sphingobium sp. HWE2-09 TaxID=3108390 RepID=UPI002DC6A34B|nr:TonB-dependent receptor [Sphingobium sp. HWE2-09]
MGALDRAPRYVVSASYTYTLPLGNIGDLALTARTRMSSEYFILAPAFGRQYRTPSYTTTDLSVKYSLPDGSFSMQGFVRNIENTIRVTALTTSGALLLIAPSDPTTYGISAGFKF